jgi:hypothetical protein
MSGSFDEAVWPAVFPSEEDEVRSLSRGRCRPREASRVVCCSPEPYERRSSRRIGCLLTADPAFLPRRLPFPRRRPPCSASMGSFSPERASTSETDSLVTRLPLFKRQALLLGFRSPSRHRYAESTPCRAFPARLRSAPSVSHTLDGLLLRYLRGPVSARSHVRDSASGVFPAAQPLRLVGASSPPVVAAALLLPSSLDSSRSRRLAFRVLIRATVRRLRQRRLASAGNPIPSCGFSTPAGLRPPTWRRLHTSSARGLLRRALAVPAMVDLQRISVTV